MDYFRAWLVAFVFTQLVEIPIYVTALQVSVVAAFGASAITHPLLCFVYLPHAHLLHVTYAWQLVVGETIVYLVETAYFAVLFRRRRAWLWSAVANVASFATGMLSRQLFGMP
jgi:hypothetical protein